MNFFYSFFFIENSIDLFR